LRDYAQELAGGVLSAAVAREALDQLEIDVCGLDRTDRIYLSTLIDKFGGGPVGIETISAALGEDRDTLEDVFEPYLLQEGFIVRTKRGREATERAYSHLGRHAPPRRPEQPSLFSRESAE
jgi:Holliday junction DNA helicase RuvB